MNKEERCDYPAKASDLKVYTDMKMFLLALEQAGVEADKLVWCVLNDRNRKLTSLYFAWHFAGRPYKDDERWDEFLGCDFSFIGDITS